MYVLVHAVQNPLAKDDTESPFAMKTDANIIIDYKMNTTYNMKTHKVPNLDAEESRAETKEADEKSGDLCKLLRKKYIQHINTVSCAESDVELTPRRYIVSTYPSTHPGTWSILPSPNDDMKIFGFFYFI